MLTEATYVCYGVRYTKCVTNLCFEYSEIRARVRKACRLIVTSSWLRYDVMRPFSLSFTEGKLLAYVRNVFYWTKSVHLQHFPKARMCHGKKSPKVMYKIFCVISALQITETWNTGLIWNLGSVEQKESTMVLNLFGCTWFTLSRNIGSQNNTYWRYENTLPVREVRYASF